VLDATKLIPEEVVPLKKIGRLVLDRNPDNFFAETEQVAFCPANIVPGLDFSDDPLLQGRLFSYLDTQLSRLGSPNHHQIPINAPKCPIRHFQRDGHMQTTVPKGRVAYEPNSLAPDGPRESPKHGFRTYPRPESGQAVRVRSESFADHYSQARLFYRSQTKPEQDHLAMALVFELGKVEIPAIRERVLTHLVHVDPSLADRVAKGLGLTKTPPPAPTTAPPKDLPASPTLSIVNKARETLEGRVVACLVSEGVDGALIDELTKSLASEKAKLFVVAPQIAGVTRSDKKNLPAQAALTAAPSVLFDAVVLALGPSGGEELAKESAALSFVQDAFAHLKFIGFNGAADPLLAATGVKAKQDSGVIAMNDAAGVAAFVQAARKHRLWSREPQVRNIP
jgi:catalase